MNYRICIVGLVLGLLLGGSQAWAEDPLLEPLKQVGVLDLVPENAFALAGMKNHDAFFEKIKGILKGQFQQPDIGEGTGWLVPNLWSKQTGGSSTQPAVIMLVNPNNLSLPELREGSEKLLVSAVPIGDLARMAENFGLSEQEFVEKKPFSHEFYLSGWFGKGSHQEFTGYRVGKHVYLSRGKESVIHAANHRSVAEFLGRAQANKLHDADLYFLLSRAVWQEEVNRYCERANLRDFFQKNPDFLKGFKGTADSTKFGLMTVQVQDDLQAQAINVFDRDHPAAVTDFLTSLAAGPGSSDLMNLPAEVPLVAFAAKGKGQTNLALFQAAVNLAFVEAGGEDRLPVVKTQAFKQGFFDLWGKLNGSRAAVYVKATDESPQGTFLAILDFEDPAEALRNLPVLLRLLEAPTKYQPEAETLLGCRVDWLDLEERIPRSEEFKRVAGEQWNRLRLAVIGNQLVLHLGSDLGLLKTTLNNIRQRRAGLAGHPVMLQSLRRLNPDRKIELHVNLVQITQLMKQWELTESQGISSAALSVSPERVQLEAYTPPSEAKRSLELFHGKW